VALAAMPAAARRATTPAMGPWSSARPHVRWLRLVAVLAVAVADDAPPVMLLVRSQETARDRERLADLRARVEKAGWPAGSVIGLPDAEREAQHSGFWAYKPWLHHFERQLSQGDAGRVPPDWVVFVETSTAVDPQQLQQLLAQYDEKEPQYIGRAIKDEVSSILHHYSTETVYPLAHAGFALSWALVQRLARHLEQHPLGQSQQIEPVWELAKWIAGTGVELSNRSDALCSAPRAGCATWVSHWPRASRPLLAEDVVIAVKTVGHFHWSRIPILHEAWGAGSSVEVLYLSNKAFSGVATAQVIDLSGEFGDMVDPNRESTKQGSGHCSKMEAILRYLERHSPGRRWYVVVDDDTLLNVHRLLEVLSSHDDSTALCVGERYGWSHREGKPGSNYITTGGGVALSGDALAKLGACRDCTCRLPHAPDDMMLGTWLTSIGVPILHEEVFHQAEPHNYHPEVLAASEAPVSFHRYGVQLPASAKPEQVDKARRANWRRWSEEHFSASAAGSARSGDSAHVSVRAGRGAEL